MTIAVGDSIPDVRLRLIGTLSSEQVSTADVLGKGRVVLFGVPAAFSPTCSDVHLPGFIAHAEELHARGVDRIFCVSVNDHYVMAAWGRSQGTGDKVSLLADGNGEFTSAVGLEMDGSGFGLGTRSQRYAMVLEDGVVTGLFVEPGGGLTVSAADAVLEQL